MRQIEAKARLAETLAKSQKMHDERLAADQPCDKPRGTCPDPPGRLPLTETSLATDVVSMWSFAVSFERLLTLHPCTIDEFCAALQRP